MEEEEKMNGGRRGDEWRMKRGWMEDEVRIEGG